MNNITKEEWIELCKKYNRWCTYAEVCEFTYEQAEIYIQKMNCWIPM